MAQPSFEIDLPADLPAADRDALLQTLRPYASVNRATDRTIDPQQVHELLHIVLQDGVLVAGAITASAGAAGAIFAAGSKGLKFLNDLLDLRDRLRKDAAKPVTVRHGEKQLNLTSASDQQVQDFLRDLIISGN